MIATLPMYLRPETQGAHDAFWALTREALRDHGIPAPDALDHLVAHDTTWTHPDLLLGQICNLPYRTHAHRVTHRVGTCDYGLPDTPAGHYFSLFVVRVDDPRDTPVAFSAARLAINEVHSHSGWGAAWAYAKAHGFTFNQTLTTGSHASSAKALVLGHADIACIDAISWQLIERFDTTAPHLRIIARSAVSPGQTLITAQKNDPAPIRAALLQALEALTADQRSTLGLCGLHDLADADYHSMPVPPQPPAAKKAA